VSSAPSRPPTDPEATSALPIGEQWRRLSPLSPVVRAAGGLVVVVFAFPSAFGRHRPGHSGVELTALIPAMVVASLVIVGGVVSWLVTRWRILGPDLQIEMGLLQRQSFRIPLARIQAVDVVAPLVGRILGLAEVRIVSAGHGAERTRLAYLTADEAARVRSQLLALAHGLHRETPEPPARPLIEVPNGRLLGSLLVRGPMLLLAVAALVSVAVPALAGSDASGDTVSGVAAVAVVAVLSLATAVLQTANAEFSFRVSLAADGYRLDRGLLQTRHETIPIGRIQAVRVVEPLVWRLFGWSRLEVDVARQHVPRRADRQAGTLGRALLPVAPRAEVAWLLAAVLPGAAPTPPPGARVPARARWKAPLSAHLLAAWHDDGHVYARTGRVTARTVIVPLAKVQSVRLSSGPVQRALRLATVHVDSAGHRWTAQAHCRDQQEGWAMLWRLADRARLARTGSAPAASA
jgi:putative membrane protein